ncbi:DUF1206 domain-containing protein [Microbispora triticiradicis]|uniref:DUF1206 domain-containing protein n=3 Tax=Microbispora TaxID=2005 RepID=A0ABY3LV10_9ACTN|nr:MULTISPECIES: DUF1206 domain-containing protein [Microbispora]RGA06610.1 DUF1206 domain-containing protein [Microbispora triticiradicis]TLP60532.1 DUF1206 domain-containing protein [Microbispora fusca]TYB54820.1 DUF1206 domain-containing protein [Microbispora tritici]
MTTAHQTGRRLEGAARRAADHPALEKLAKVGFAARGVLYAIIGLVALQIAFGGGGEADKSSALQIVRDSPLGDPLLWIMAVGLAALVIWQVSEAVWGRPEARERVEAVSRAVVYAALVYSMVALLTRNKGASSSDSQSEDATKALFDLPAGQFLVGLMALGVIALGVYWIYEGWTEKFMRDMHVTEPRTRGVVVKLGKAGYIARGVIALAAGALIGQAALTYDPDKAAGIDDALKALADTPAGPWLLVVVAIGLVLFAVYCFAEARWHRV